MKVLLVYPTWHEAYHYYPPLGLGYIGAYLEQEGHQVRILDRDLAFQDKKAINLVDRESESTLRAFQPDLIGITAMTPTIPDAFHTAALLKRQLPKYPVVLGGPHAMVLSKETLEASANIDIVVKGEGEETMKELCGGSEPGSVAGIVYRKNGDIVATPNRNLSSDLNSLLFPARHLYDMKKYLQSNFAVIRGVDARVMNLMTSRGCPYRCTFCAASCIFGGKVRFASPSRVIEEIERILSEYPQVEGLYFVEDSFATSRKRAVAICNLLLKRRIHRRIIWAAQLHVNDIDEELLTLMKKAGCVQVQYGFESGSQRILNLMDKRATVRQNYEAAVLTRKVGVRFLVNVIVGFPSETREDFMATIELLKATRPNFIGYGKFIPLPGSKMFNDLKQRIVVDNDWTKYHSSLSNNHYLNFSAMSDKEFNNLAEHYWLHLVQPTGEKGYISYNLPRKPFRTLKNIVVNHMPKPFLTVKDIAGRIADDPAVISRRIKRLIAQG